MSDSPDIRWKQRFANYNKALQQLEKFIVKKSLSELEEQGLIQSFEYTFELGWNTLKDFLEFQGESNIFGSKDAIRLAFKRGLIEDGETWMKMVESRTQTSHSYDEKLAKTVVQAIQEKYLSLFMQLRTKLQALE